MEHVQIPGANKLHVLQFIKKNVSSMISFSYSDQIQTIFEFDPIV